MAIKQNEEEETKGGENYDTFLQRSVYNHLALGATEKAISSDFES